jgi:hypothetical protein
MNHNNEYEASVRKVFAKALPPEEVTQLAEELRPILIAGIKRAVKDFELSGDDDMMDLVTGITYDILKAPAFKKAVLAAFTQALEK